MDKRNYKKRIIWTETAEQILIDLWEDKILQLRGNRKNQHVYMQIAAELQENGFSLTATDVKNKVHNLTARYRKEKALVRENGGSPSEWLLYPRLHSFIGSYRYYNLSEANCDSKSASSAASVEAAGASFTSECTLEELCKKRWEETCEQFANELKNIPLSLSQKSELSKEEYDPHTAWPYFKSLLFLKNNMKAQKPAGSCNVAEDFPDTLNEANFDDSFTESDEDIPAWPVRKKPKINSDCAAEILAKEHRKLELLKNKVSIQKDQRNADNAFFDSLLPYMKLMDMRQKMLCRMELQTTVYNYAFSADT